MYLKIKGRAFLYDKGAEMDSVYFRYNGEYRAILFTDTRERIPAKEVPIYKGAGVSSVRCIMWNNGGIRFSRMERVKATIFVDGFGTLKGVLANTNCNYPDKTPSYIGIVIIDNANITYKVDAEADFAAYLK